MKASKEISQVIAGWFEAVARGDTSWVDDHVSREEGVRLVGTDPKEWLQGTAVNEFMKTGVQAMGGSVKIEPGEPEAYAEGSVGWGIAHPRITLPDGKTISPRWSAVLRKEDGAWRLVQIHASVGVANEELLGDTAMGS